MSDFNYSNNPNTWTQTEGVSVSQQKPDGGVVGATVNTVALVGNATPPGITQSVTRRLTGYLAGSTTV